MNKTFLRRGIALMGSLLLLLTLATPLSALAAENADGYDEVVRFSNFEREFLSGAFGNSIYADWTSVPTTDVTDGHDLANLRLQLKFTLTGPQGDNTQTTTWNKGGYIKLRSSDMVGKEGDPDIESGLYPGNHEHNFGWNLSSQSSNPIRLYAGENELLIPLLHFEGDGYSVNHRGLIDWTAIDRILMVIDGKDMKQGVADHKLTVTYAAIVDVHEPVSANTGVQMPTLFGNNMMFQRDKDMKIWGWGEPGEQVTVTFAKRGESTPLQTKTATVDTDGNWSVTLDAIAGSYQEYTMTATVRSGETEIGKKVIDHILIGEVWAAGGQSNMAFEVMNDLYADEYLEAANNDTIRMFIEPNFPLGDNAPQPKETQIDVPGAYWATGADDGDLAGVSAVAYHFSLDMQEKLDMPVGFLYTPVGGSVIEAWISREAIEQDEEYKQFLISKNKYCDDENWPDKGNRMSGLYIQKIGALAGYNVAGTIWYQGESNSGEPEMYGHALNILREDWGRVFGYENGEDMPFVFTMVQPWRTDLDNPQFLGYFAEGMYDGWQESEDTDMAMVALYDLPLYHINKDGNSSDPIHPRHKQPVGQRMATAAYNMLYAEDAEYTSPVYESMEPVDLDSDGINDAIDVTFDHVGDGLEAINAVYAGDGFGQNTGDGLGVLSETDDLHGFTLAGTGGVYVDAKAIILDEDTVRVWSEGLKNPVNVAYNFYTYYTGGTLKNSVDMPAVPFRSERSDTSAYFNAQDWKYADADVWVGLNQNNTNIADFLDSWVSNPVSGGKAEWSYDAKVKTEGKASLKVTYTPDSTNTAGIGPVLGYDTVVNQFDNFDTITVAMKNEDAREKELSLLIRSGGKTYQAAVAEDFAATDENTALLAASADFTDYVFSLRHLTDENGQRITETNTILCNVEQLQFTVTDTKAGTVYLDDVRFGFLYDANVDKSALADELNKAVDPTLYTEDSLADYAVTRESAQAVMDDPVANQSQVDRMTQTLKEHRENLVEINVAGTFSKFERVTYSGNDSIYADWTMGDNTPIDLTQYDMSNLRLQLKFTLTMPEGFAETTRTFNQWGWVKLRSVDTPEENNYGWEFNPDASNPIKLHAGENELLIPLTNTTGDGYKVTVTGKMDWSKVNRILMCIISDEMRGYTGQFSMNMVSVQIVDISVNNEKKAELQEVIDTTVDTQGVSETKVAAYEAAKKAAQAVCTDDTASLTDIADARKALEKAIAGLHTQPGDVNNSGEVTAEDALMALQAATSKITLDDTARLAADVDGQAGVTANDALLILQYATKKISTL